VAGRGSLRSVLLCVAVLLCAGWPAVSVAQSLPTGWTLTDIGQSPSPGEAQVVSRLFDLTATGGDVSGTADRFTFVHRTLIGDATIVARLTALRNAGAESQVGLMIRGSSAPGSSHAFVFASPGKGVAIRTRKASGAATKEVSGGEGSAFIWLRLRRKASMITASRSADGVEWTTIGAVTIPMHETALVGLAVAGHGDSAKVSARVSNVRLTGLDTVNTPPTVALTAPASGANYPEPAIITVAAAADDADGKVAKVDFFAGPTLLGSDATRPYKFTWNDVPAGLYVLTAVATDDRGATTSSETRTVTVSAPDERSESQTSPEAPATPQPAGSVSESRPGRSFAEPSFQPASPSTTNTAPSPTSPTSPSTSLKPSVISAQVGVSTSSETTAVADAATGAAQETTVSDTTAPSSNASPTVALTSPTNGAAYALPSTVTFTATAADADGSIQQVEFYVGSSLVGVDTTSPYSATWSTATTGTYGVSAVARDNQGAMTVSTWHDITVAAAAVPGTAIFTPAVPHESVQRYLLKIFTVGSDVALASPVASQDLGTPAVVNNECSVDVSSTILALAPGSYVATLVAVTPDGDLSTAPFAFTR
jgi:hypothetical protein